ncbi:response regulator [Vibrio sp. SM6]|uniref:Autoinducer 2 sensor kinase/phosphatase LuxQ n=1 Tax=Vibrio agarilyticus TaxID=2726741 RepID=A0A7X8TPA3_9VIBR|nr:quorum-sensing autoinducer 2 sensor kinase/phosphatase LuxQ [Vibrio agarilyticus]NLS12121.1 response regulator [Vibrio agarilyticus]
MDSRRIKQRYSLATLITRIVVLVLGFMTLGIFLQNNYFSNQIIEREVVRSRQQTSALLHNLFDNHFSVIQMLHDSNAKSEAIRDYYRRGDSEALSDFFVSIDQTDSLHTPEFRFLTRHNHIIWEDGNALFYGVNDTALAAMAKEVAVSGRWQYVPMATLRGRRHMLVRRSPAINNETGEVLGQVYVSVVLDNNYPLLELLQTESNSNDVVLLVDQTPIADSLNSDEPYDLDTIVANYGLLGEFRNYLITKTPIQINDAITGLMLLSIQDNSNVASMQKRHLIAIVISIFIMIVFSLLIRKWVQNRVSNSLKSLMNYTKSAGDSAQFRRFSGSDIQEFEHIGITLQDTFEQLESQKRSFQDLFNFALSPIMVWSEEGQLLQMNPAARRELVVEQLDSVERGHPVFQRFRLKLTPHLLLAAEGATLTGINVPIADKIFRWNLSPIKVESGISGIIVQGQDITTLIEAEKQSNFARREAEKSAQARADFLARMSHEIRTPLNGILGVAQLLRHSIDKPESQKQIEVLCNSGEHLLAVLNDILDFSKIEQGKFDIQKSDFLFSDSVNTLENIYRPLCEAKDVDFIINDHLPPQVRFYTDQVRLNQILFNLSSNAVKFTHKGSITIDFILEEFIHAECDVLSIRLSDTGIGIESEKLNRIFDPFVQAEATTTRVYGGSGLGLAIVKNLVAMLKGDIHVTSQPGSGTTFVVNIPVQRAKTTHSPAPSRVKIEPQDLFETPQEVLLVEDNHTNAFIITTFCEKYRMKVVWVKDGYDALETLKERHFDLILMDNQLPKLGGIETTTMIRTSLKLDMPIYACTADTQLSTRDAFFAAGANYVIVKPIKEHELHNAFIDYHTRFVATKAAQSEDSLS